MSLTSINPSWTSLGWTCIAVMTETDSTNLKTLTQNLIKLGYAWRMMLNCDPEVKHHIGFHSAASPWRRVHAEVRTVWTRFKLSLVYTPRAQYGFLHWYKTKIETTSIMVNSELTVLSSLVVSDHELYDQWRWSLSCHDMFLTGKLKPRVIVSIK